MWNAGKNNMGFGFNRDTWNVIKGCAEVGIHVYYNIIRLIRLVWETGVELICLPLRTFVAMMTTTGIGL